MRTGSSLAPFADLSLAQQCQWSHLCGSSAGEAHSITLTRFFSTTPHVILLPQAQPPKSTTSTTKLGFDILAPLGVASLRTSRRLARSLESITFILFFHFFLSIFSVFFHTPLGPYCASLFLYLEIQHHLTNLFAEYQKYLYPVDGDEAIDIPLSTPAKRIPLEILDIAWCSPNVESLVKVTLKYTFQGIIFVEERQVASTLGRLLETLRAAGHHPLCSSRDAVKLFRDKEINIYYDLGDDDGDITDLVDLAERERYVIPSTEAILSYDNAINLIHHLFALISRDAFTPHH
ncbi:hypothetical protein K443DRAFT_10921 [Laccaria amethystina LaAM-08-1]|uniref:Uncharacterized protein n=1 Tax=Laccaria amethystina LaAM-08-1 TaxID=1095629 RepID=A0A0C9WK93_9AGAR|nr:hypothetical protein K443DRAFT_10921 [Laccaria amethystina LaAM-08-1]